MAGSDAGITGPHTSQELGRKKEIGGSSSSSGSKSRLEELRGEDEALVRMIQEKKRREREKLGGPSSSQHVESRDNPIDDNAVSEHTSVADTGAESRDNSVADTGAASGNTPPVDKPSTPLRDTSDTGLKDNEAAKSSNIREDTAIAGPSAPPKDTSDTRSNTSYNHDKSSDANTENGDNTIPGDNDAAEVASVTQTGSGDNSDNRDTESVAGSGYNSDDRDHSDTESRARSGDTADHPRDGDGGPSDRHFRDDNSYIYQFARIVLVLFSCALDRCFGVSPDQGHGGDGSPRRERHGRGDGPQRPRRSTHHRGADMEETHGGPSDDRQTTRDVETAGDVQRRRSGHRQADPRVNTGRSSGDRPATSSATHRNSQDQPIVGMTGDVQSQNRRRTSRSDVGRRRYEITVNGKKRSIKVQIIANNIKEALESFNAWTEVNTKYSWAERRVKYALTSINTSNLNNSRLELNLRRYHRRYQRRYQRDNRSRMVKNESRVSRRRHK